MKFIPILFSTAMVRAIKEDRKDVTRRVITKQNSTSTNDDWRKFDFNDAVVDGKDSAMEYLKVARPEDGTRHRIFPKIYPKDVWGDERESGVCLWVRETFRAIEQDNGGYRYEYKESETIDIESPWKPSIFMPKDACRLFLEVISVRPERLQDITEEDAKREGLIREWDGSYYWYNNYYKGGPAMFKSNPIESFASLWKSINGEESWNSNPWIWRIEYKKIERHESFLKQ